MMLPYRILDDVEMYEDQKPFSLDDLIGLSDMLNQLVFKIIYYDVIGLYYCTLHCSSSLFIKLGQSHNMHYRLSPTNIASI